MYKRQGITVSDSSLTVLDPCAGFGGRLLGFLASKKGGDYIGVDPNTALIPCYRDLTERVRRYSPEVAKRKAFRMVVGCAETVDWPHESGHKPGSVDIVLTSPPYFDTERYTNEPTQSLSLIHI